MFRDCKGFTTVELIVTMGLVGIVTAFAYTSYIFVIRGINNWQDRIEMENTSHIIINAISRDLMAMEELFLAEETAIRFVKTTHDTIDYRQKTAKLVKNGMYIDEVKKISYSILFKYFGSDLSLDLNMDGIVDFYELDKNGDGYLTHNELLYIDLVEISLTLANLNREFSIQTAVAPRSLKNIIVQ
jgi:prepilin-type N-terminal cleavage/methylation domain-containing protein